jgi:hypothetical protein
MPNDKTPPSTHDVMARLLAQKKAAGSKTPEHTEFGGKGQAPRGPQFTPKPQRPGGSRGRG